MLLLFIGGPGCAGPGPETAPGLDEAVVHLAVRAPEPSGRLPLVAEQRISDDGPWDLPRELDGPVLVEARGPRGHALASGVFDLNRVGLDELELADFGPESTLEAALFRHLLERGVRPGAIDVPFLRSLLDEQQAELFHSVARVGADDHAREVLGEAALAALVVRDAAAEMELAGPSAVAVPGVLASAAWSMTLRAGFEGRGGPLSALLEAGESSAALRTASSLGEGLRQTLRRRATGRLDPRVAQGAREEARLAIDELFRDMHRTQNATRLELAFERFAAAVAGDRALFGSALAQWLEAGQPDAELLGIVGGGWEAAIASLADGWHAPANEVPLDGQAVAADVLADFEEWQQRMHGLERQLSARWPRRAEEGRALLELAGWARVCAPCGTRPR